MALISPQIVSIANLCQWLTMSAELSAVDQLIGVDVPCWSTENGTRCCDLGTAGGTEIEYKG
jgi:hypothetical protein